MVDSPWDCDWPRYPFRPLDTWNQTRTVNAFSGDECKMASSTSRQSSGTSEPPTFDQWPEWWISSLRVSHANHIHTLGNVLEEKIQETSGLIPYGLYGKWDRSTSCWRMSGDWLTGLSHIVRKLLGVFPRQGTLQFGVCVPLPKQELPTLESGGFYLPTLHANKLTSNCIDLNNLVDSHGNPWVPGMKPHDKRTGNQVTTTLHDWTRYLWQEKPFPLFGEWMMGLPIGWTALEPLGMESYRQWLQGFLGANE